MERQILEIFNSPPIWLSKKMVNTEPVFEFLKMVMKMQMKAIYLAGAERTEREGPILQGGDESGVLPVPIDTYIR
jgi:hypothetical protein